MIESRLFKSFDIYHKAPAIHGFVYLFFNLFWYVTYSFITNIKAFNLCIVFFRARFALKLVSNALQTAFNRCVSVNHVVVVVEIHLLLIEYHLGNPVIPPVVQLFSTKLMRQSQRLIKAPVRLFYSAE